MIYKLGTMRLGESYTADPHKGPLTFTEIRKRGFRVIGGDKGDLRFDGYSANPDGTEVELARAELVSELELSLDEVAVIALDVLAEAWESIGEEAMQGSGTSKPQSTGGQRGSKANSAISKPDSPATP